MKFMNGIRKTTVLWLVLGTTLVLSGTFFFDARAQGLGISGPHVHKNLTIFLIRGQDRLSGKVPLTLEEALKQKRVIVHETGDVNELAIENVSQDAEIFVQSGDIVKGGRQDRVISITFLVPARSGRIPIAAFCVEHGRWTPRAGELAVAFEASNAQIATRELKLAVRLKGEQQEVWKDVAEAQGKLSSGLGVPVAPAASPSSLQLTLENTRLRDSVDEYIRALAPIVEKSPGVVGFAFAVNGKLSGAEVYGSSGLFQKIWAKSLRASAVEAIAESTDSQKFKQPTAADVTAFMNEADRAGASEKQITPRFTLLTKESLRNVLFETRDGRAKATLHRSYVRK